MDYKIIYSKRRSIALCVKDTAVTVRAPFGLKKEHIEGFVNSHIKWVEKRIAEQKRRKENEQALTDENIASLKKSAKLYFTQKTEEYAKLMGLKYGRITITSAKTRFGSCNSKGNICFSYRLMLYPEEARDYVIVHELSHLIELNHSKHFYAIIEAVMPDYKERKKLLKSI